MNLKGVLCVNKRNEVKVEFLSKSENESFSRMVVASLVSQLDPTIEELNEVKTAVSEAVTNCIVHAYNGKTGYIFLECILYDDEIQISIKDNGKGIEDVAKAREPLYTTNTDMERSGMGFTVMETFMDTVNVDSIIGVGTKVTMTKKICANRL